MKARIMAMVLGAATMAAMWEAIPPPAQAGDQNRGSARAVGGKGGDASATGGVAIGGRGGDAKPGNPSTATNDCHAKQGRAGRATAGEAAIGGQGGRGGDAVGGAGGAG